MRQKEVPGRYCRSNICRGFRHLQSYPCQGAPKVLREFFVSRCRRGVWGTEKLIGKLKDFIAKVKAYFDGLTTNTKAEAALLKEMRDGGLHYLERIVEAYDKAATAAVESYQGAETRSEASENQYMARGRYWQPQLKRAEWELLERRMNAEIKSGENFLDEATKWVYADEKGVQVFALYGIGDGTDATPLYAVGGKKAAAYNAAMTEFMERKQKYDGDGRSVDPLPEFLWRKEWSRSGNLSQTSRKAGDAEGVSELHGGSQRSDSGRASGRGTENQRGVKDQFSLREPVEETRDLLALHNMTADNLRGALKPVRQPKEFSKFGNGALQQLVSEVGVQELARINAERQE